MTISYETIDGRKATIAYINDELELVDRDEATMIKIVFDDGEIRFGVKAKQDRLKSQFASEKRRAMALLQKYEGQPRDHGRFSFGKESGDDEGGSKDANDKPMPSDRPAPPPGEMDNGIDPNASNNEKVRQLNAMSKVNKPAVDEFAATVSQLAPGGSSGEQVLAMLKPGGAVSESGLKEPHTIIAKATRPDILKEKPWYGVEHIRDSLRFRTTVDSFKDVKKLVDELEASGKFEIVKYDYKKLTEPKKFGWRILPIDMKMKNGQIVEYYILPRELREVADEGHKMYKEWREMSDTQINALPPKDRERYEKDTLYQRNLYKGAWDRYFARTGETESDLLASVKR